METAVAMHPFVAREDNEISFELGEVITVVSKHNEDWWEGINSAGKQGFFPQNHVAITDTKPPPPPKGPAEFVPDDLDDGASGCPLAIWRKLIDSTDELERVMRELDMAAQDTATMAGLAGEADGDSTDDDDDGGDSGDVPPPAPPPEETLPLHAPSDPSLLVVPDTMTADLTPSPRSTTTSSSEIEPEMPAEPAVEAPKPAPRSKTSISHSTTADEALNQIAPATPAPVSVAVSVPVTATVAPPPVAPKKAPPEIAPKQGTKIALLAQAVTASPDAPPTKDVESPPLAGRKGGLVSQLQQQVLAEKPTEIPKERPVIKSNIAALKQGLAAQTEEKPKETTRPKFDMQRDPNAPSLAALQQNLAAATGGGSATATTTQPQKPREVIERDANSPSLASLQQSLAANLGGGGGGTSSTAVPVPTTSTQQPQASTTATTLSDGEAPLLPDWRAATDPHGRTYYFHTKTKETTWARPTAPVPPAAPAPSPAPAIPAPTPPAAVSVAVATVAAPVQPQGRAPAPMAPAAAPTRAPAPAVPTSRAPALAPSIPSLVTMPPTLQPKGPTRAAAPGPPVPSIPTLAPPNIAAVPVSPMTSVAPTIPVVAMPVITAPVPVVAPTADVNAPDNWRDARAPDGRIYYYNVITKETSWSVPQGQAQQHPPAAPPAATAPLLPTSQPLRPSMALPPVPTMTLPTPPSNSRPVSIASAPEGAEELVDSDAQALLEAQPAMDEASMAVKRKENFVFLKRNKVDGGRKSSSRKWINAYGILCRGVVYFYEKNPNLVQYKMAKGGGKDMRPFMAVDVRKCSLSLSDHKKREHVITIITAKGSEWLLQALDSEDQASWVNALQIEREFERPESRIMSSSNKKENRKSMKLSSRGGSGVSSGEQTDEKEKVKQKIGWFVSNRPSAEKLQQAGILNTSSLCFGGRLVTQFEKANNQIPRIILQCVDAVERRGLLVVGIYRLSGNVADIQKLRYSFNQDQPLDLINDPRWSDINVITGALKLYLRELENPLLTFERYDALIEISKMQNHDQKLIQLRSTIQGLPRAHFETLRFLFNHLKRVVAHAPTNRMETPNVAIVFGPTAMRPIVEDMDMVFNTAFQTAVVELLLTYYDYIFG